LTYLRGLSNLDADQLIRRISRQIRFRRRDAYTGFLAKARVRGTVRVIARLKTHVTLEGGLPAEEVSAQRRTIHGLQNELMEALAGTGTRVMARFRVIPYIALEVNALQRVRPAPTMRLRDWVQTAC
jgi:hypothetical protein